MFELFKQAQWLSGSPNGVMGAILGGVRTLCFEIMTIIYKLIVLMYDLFERLCSTRILSNEVIGTMSKRVGLLLGLVMFFYVIFALIQMLLNPDKITDKESGAGAIVKKTIFVIVMLGASSFGFELLYDVQAKIIDTGLISRIILPYSISGNPQDNFGNLLSLQLVKSFYRVGENIENVYEEDKVKFEACGTGALVGLFYEDVYYDSVYNIGYMCLNESVRVNVNNVSNQIANSTEDEVFLIDYNGIVAILTGVYVVYMLLIYCFKVGVRMVQLAFLEIISPMAIISHLTPKKDNMLSKWWKIYFSTYIDAFLRIAIINFVIFLICTLFASDDMNGGFNLAGLGDSSTGESLFFMVVIILSLLTFAKKAPDLIKELFPGGAAKLGLGTSMKDIVGLKEFVGWGLGVTTGAAMGLLGGAAAGLSGNTGWKKITGLATGALGGTLGGIWNGGKAGASAKGLGKAISSAREKQAKANLERAQRHLAGARWYDNIGNGVNGYFGQIGAYERLESEVSSLKDLKADVEDDDLVKGAINTLNSQYQAYVNSGGKAGFETWRKASSMSDGNGIGGQTYDAAVDAAKDTAYKTMYKKGEAFTEKVNMHNRRFGTKYNDGTSWANINSTRKINQAELERQRARKPKK